MAGHSKWANIKHRKAAADAKKGKLYTKLAREIESAARQGGGDPELNYTLRLAVDKAKAENMPNDNIERAIKRGTGELQGEELEEVYYEGYGPNGTAMMFKCLTDNRNRTVGDIRSALRKGGGTLAESGAVAWQFGNKGLIIVPMDGNDPDEIMLLAIDAGAEDVTVDDDVIEVITAREDLQKVAEFIKGEGIETESVDLAMIPQHYVELPVDDQIKVMNLIERLEDLDDVQEIYTNVEFSSEALEAVS
ncbi:MAG: YebC/PmpR family DNA-binding transcriptional regulator [Chloroflexota bacterium]|nr:YebC/PmpR family DNA-binding transcriptional regulator [Chloroflexota bacterium]